MGATRGFPRHDGENETAELAAPSSETAVQRWTVVGPFSPGEEPAPRTLLEMPFSHAALEVECGITPIILAAKEDHGVVRVSDRFALPRGQVYYLRSFVHAEYETEAWLRFSAPTTAYFWYGTRGFELTYHAETENVTRELPIPSFRGRATRIFLPAGTTPLLVRVLDYSGQTAVRVALQDEDGNLPPGLSYEPTQ
jgi:hypothetical protein